MSVGFAPAWLYSVAVKFVTRLREVPAIGWALISLLLAVGVVWALGGFKSADGGTWMGVETKAGETIPTRFWDVTVHDAAAYVTGPRIEVAVTLTNKQGHPVTPDDYLVVVRIPDYRDAWIDPYCRTVNDRPFNPNIAVEALCVYRPEDPEDGEEARLDDLTGLTELDIEVIVFEQALSESVMDGSTPVSDHPIARIPFTIPVHE